MISHVLLVLMLAPNPNVLASARATYSRCLGDLTRAEVKARTDEAGFQAKLQAACKSEEAAFRNASIAVDLGAKISRASAEQNAQDEIGYIRDNAVETYKSYLEPKS